MADEATDMAEKVKADGAADKAKPKGDKSRDRKRSVRYLSVAASVKEAADAGDQAAQNELTLSVGSALTYALLEVADAVRDATDGAEAPDGEDNQ